MIFVSLFLITLSIVGGLMLVGLLRLTEAERPSFLSSTPRLIFLAAVDLFCFFLGLMLLLGPVFS